MNKFIHCDCDCFFAAIEIRDDPSLRGLPVAVGGAEDRRGVIATCNYEARRFGVHSAMPSGQARRLCPDLIIIPGNMEKYREASRQLQAIFRDYTELIEPLSLDEAYLDVTGTLACQGSATLIAREIRRRAREEVGITVSAGIAPNKFLAKIASDWRKPDGQYVITPDMVDAFVLALPVRKLHGVGKVLAGRMESLGIGTCRDLQGYSKVELARLFGSFGERLYALCRGIDERPVRTERERKSISVEQTFAQDLEGLQQCLAILPDLLDQLRRRIGRAEAGEAIAKLFVKIRFHDFVATTVEQQATELDPALFARLCRTGYERGHRPVRLLGLGIRLKEAEARTWRQLPLALPSLEEA